MRQKIYVTGSNLIISVKSANLCVARSGAFIRPDVLPSADSRLWAFSLHVQIASLLLTATSCAGMALSTLWSCVLPSGAASAGSGSSTCGCLSRFHFVLRKRSGVLRHIYICTRTFEERLRPYNIAHRGPPPYDIRGNPALSPPFT